MYETQSLKSADALDLFPLPQHSQKCPGPCVSETAFDLPLNANGQDLDTFSIPALPQGRQR